MLYKTISRNYNRAIQCNFQIPELQKSENFQNMDHFLGHEIISTVFYVIHTAVLGNFPIMNFHKFYHNILTSKCKNREKECKSWDKITFSLYQLFTSLLAISIAIKIYFRMTNHLGVTRTFYFLAKSSLYFYMESLKCHIDHFQINFS